MRYLPELFCSLQSRARHYGALQGMVLCKNYVLRCALRRTLRCFRFVTEIFYHINGAKSRKKWRNLKKSFSVKSQRNLLCFEWVGVLRENTCRILTRFIECYSEEEIKFDRLDEPRTPGLYPATLRRPWRHQPASALLWGATVTYGLLWLFCFLRRMKWAFVKQHAAMVVS
jgi:hypothetical protein